MWVHVAFIIYFLQDLLLLCSARNGEVENVTLALTLGANVKIINFDRAMVSTLIKLQ